MTGKCNKNNDFFLMSPAVLLTVVKVQQQPLVMLRGKASLKSGLSYTLYDQLPASEGPVSCSRY